MPETESSFEKVRRKLVAARLDFLSRLRDFSSDELTAQAPDEQWTPLQIAWHIGIAEKLVLEQMRRVQAEDNPLIMQVSVEAPHQTNQTLPTSLQAVLARLDEQREELFAFLASLPAEAWERPLRDAEWGELKFYQVVNILPFHERQHAQQLEAMKAKLTS